MSHTKAISLISVQCFLSFKAEPDERVPSDWEKYCLEEYGLLIAEEGGNDDGLVHLLLV
jgi:hypothetical protein